MWKGRSRTAISQTRKKNRQFILMIGIKYQFSMLQMTELLHRNQFSFSSRFSLRSSKWRWEKGKYTLGVFGVVFLRQFQLNRTVYESLPPSLVIRGVKGFEAKIFCCSETLEIAFFNQSMKIETCNFVSLPPQPALLF